MRRSATLLQDAAIAQRPHAEERAERARLEAHAEERADARVWKHASDVPQLEGCSSAREDTLPDATVCLPPCANRRGQYRKATLIERYGPERVTLMMWAVGSGPSSKT
jgi:hypothetical protein